MLIIKTKSQLKALQREYLKATKDNLEFFTFNGELIVTDFAYYLLEYAKINGAYEDKNK